MRLTKLHLDSIIKQHIISSIDKHCFLHRIDYLEETHRLPSGKHWITLCPKCKEKEEREKIKFS